MQIETFTGGNYAANGYLIYEKDEAMIVDVPAHTAKKIHEFLQEQKLNLKYIIVTHVHWDHIEDVDKLKKYTDAKIGIHRFDEQLQIEINSIFEGETGIIKADFSLADNEEITIGAYIFRVIHTPGHTPGSICIYNEKEKILFSGDVLFEGAYGRIDFPLSNTEDMKNSLIRLSKLPSETKVYSGHGKETTIGREKWIKNL